MIWKNKNWHPTQIQACPANLHITEFLKHIQFTFADTALLIILWDIGICGIFVHNEDFINLQVHEDTQAVCLMIGWSYAKVLSGKQCRKRKLEND